MDIHQLRNNNVNLCQAFSLPQWMQFGKSEQDNFKQSCVVYSNYCTSFKVCV